MLRYRVETRTRGKWTVHADWPSLDLAEKDARSVDFASRDVLVTEYDTDDPSISRIIEDE